MARTEQITYAFSCDLCGREIADKDQESASYKVTLGSGRSSAVYEVDLCKPDAAKLTKAMDGLKTILGAGRRASGSAPRGKAAPSSKGRGRSASTGDANAIRQWAHEQGYEVSDRGRISAALREAYAAG